MVNDRWVTHEAHRLRVHPAFLPGRLADCRVRKVVGILARHANLKFLGMTAGLTVWLAA